MGTKLYENLCDNQINRENLKLFLEEYQKNPENFIAFLGAGISASLKKVPDTEELYIWLCDRYNIKSDKHYIEENTNKNWPEKFAGLYQQIGNSDREGFDKDVLEKMISSDTSGTITHIRIAKAFNRFVTTNYHEPVEEGFKITQENSKKTPGRLKKYFFMFPPEGKTENTITYLHGNCEVGFCILRTKDYQYFYPSLYDGNLGVYIVENSLTKILTGWSVVFLGSSLETHLMEFMRYLPSRIDRENINAKDTESKKQMKTHYLVISDSAFMKCVKSPEDTNRYFEKYAKINVKPIIYHGGHIFVEKLCENLSEIKDRKMLDYAGDTYKPESR